MRPTVRMIAQAHLDPVWLWRWTEGRAEALATSRSAVDRLHEYPTLHFTRGEAQVYEWIEEESPELLAEIKALIRAGRWHVVNGMVVQPDMNLPQGESLVRQALLGKRYLAEKLGVDVRVAYCVDSFGHAGTLPQILKQCGCDYYVFLRPEAHEKDLPPQPFWWQGPDGSRVLAYRISGAYCHWPADVAPHVARALADMPPTVGDTMCFFGVGNHGGGPTVAQIENVLRLAAERQDVAIRFDHPEAYFEAIAPRAAQLPVVADELQYHAAGCYSVNSRLKRTHRQAECALLVAERLVCLAAQWAGCAPQRGRLRGLWHDLLFNQFHDTLAGSSIKEAEDEAIMALGRVIVGAREIADTACRQIGSRVDTAGPGSTVLLFNPSPYARREYVEYEPWTENQRWQRCGWGLVDEAGRAVAHQVLEAQAAVGNAERGIERLVWPADLPALGYRLYRFARGVGDEGRAHRRGAEDAEKHQSLSASSAPLRWNPVAQASAVGLENDVLAVRLDPATGAIVSCRDKASGVEFVGPGGWNVAQVLEDTSDTWSHGVRAFDRVFGEFGAPRIAVGEQGPLQASLYLERSWEGSTWLQQLILRAGERELLLRNW
ncbi:MAG TPA: alpha-mannosidase, partial [Anaerolineae bacterium]|nr:alpha-mannosidase [Anaerolineae bacterium]